MHRIARPAVLLSFLLAAPFIVTAQTSPEYVSPAQAGPHGSAPGMKVKLLSENAGQRDFAVIFSPGDDPYAGLTEFAQKYDVKSAHFTAIGDFRDVKLGWFDMQKKMFRVNPVDQRVEVGSLVGDIALLDGKPSVHMHCVVALQDGTTRGGHVLEAHVDPLLEVFVTVDPVPLVKKHDPATGLNVIQPDATP